MRAFQCLIPRKGIETNAYCAIANFINSAFQCLIPRKGIETSPCNLIASSEAFQSKIPRKGIETRFSEPFFRVQALHPYRCLF